MKDETVIKTFWTPAGQSYHAEHTLTWAEAKEWKCDWVDLVERGSRFLVLDFTDQVNNPGRLVVLVNVI